MSNIRKTAKAVKAPVKSTLDDLAEQELNIFKGLFRVWKRDNVPEKVNGELTGKTVTRYKCVCQRSLANGDTVDISAWITEECAKHFGIDSNGATFAGKFAYDTVELVQPKGQYNEERNLRSARLLGIVD